MIQPLRSEPGVSPFKLFATAIYADAAWVEGWVFFVWFVAMSAHCTAWVYRHDPALPR